MKILKRYGLDVIFFVALFVLVYPHYRASTYGQGQSVPRLSDQYLLKVQEVDAGMGVVIGEKKTVDGKLIQVTPGQVCNAIYTFEFEYLTIRTPSDRLVTVVYPYTANFVVGEQVSVDYMPLSSNFIQSHKFIATFYPDTQQGNTLIVSICADGIVATNGVRYR